MSKRERNRHWSVKDAARCVAYARRDNPNDDLLIAKYVIEAFGLPNVPCMMSEGVLMISNVVFVGSTLWFLKGVLNIVKGLKIVFENKISRVTVSPIEIIIRKYFPSLQEAYGLYVLYLGATATMISSLIIFVDTLADQLEYYAFLGRVCSTKVEANPYPITPRMADFEVFLKDDYINEDMVKKWSDLHAEIFPES